MSSPFQAIPEPPPLPFDPKPMSVHRDRYYAAIEPEFPMEEVEAGKLTRPGQIPAHTFDFHDGIRMIISKDSIKKVCRIHLSASCIPDSYVYKMVQRKTITPQIFVDMVYTRFQELCAETVDLKFLQFTPVKGVPHWLSDPL